MEISSHQQTIEQLSRTNSKLREDYSRARSKEATLRAELASSNERFEDALAQLDQERREGERARRDTAASEAKVAELEKEVTKWVKKESQWREDLRKQKEEAAQLKVASISLSEELEREKQLCREAEERAEGDRAAAVDNEKLLLEAENACETLKIDAKAYTRRIGDLETTEKLLRKRVQDAEMKLHAASEGELATQTEAQLMQSAAEDVEQELALLKQTHTSDLERLNALQEELREEAQRCQQSEAALTKAEDRLAGMEQQLKVATAKERALQEANARISADVAAKQSDYQRLVREKTELETRLRTLEQNTMEAENALKISRVLGSVGSAAAAGHRDTELQLKLARDELRAVQVSALYCSSLCFHLAYSDDKRKCHRTNLLRARRSG